MSDPDVPDESSATAPRRDPAPRQLGRTFRDETELLAALEAGSFGPFEPADYGDRQ